MKIAFFHELPYGGARRAVLEFGKQLKNNNTIDLYYLDDKPEKYINEIFNITRFIHFTPKTWAGHNWKIKLYKDFIELFKIYIIHKKLAREIDKKGYDFVFVHGSKYTQAPFLLRFLKTKSVYYCQEPLRMVYEELFDITHTLSFERRTYERLTRKIRKIIDSQNVHNASILLANSQFTRKNIKKAYNLDAIVCYMGVDISRFHPEKCNKKYDILFIGSMEEIDGYELLQKAITFMKKAPRVRYVLREKEWISDDAVMRRLYSSSRLLTCLGYKEPFGLLPIEAQACGIPVIAVNEGGYKDTVINNVTGLLIQRDPRVLSKTIDQILSDQKKINNLGDNAFKNVQKNWTWEKSSENLLKIIYPK